ncbi:cytidine deaminase [Ligilactobacillus salitolerans]|uniref:Cytidine deaminase n=1 Tax=Ligilactobacillus salitolerans TaxID=1808352 RepID=A0A401IQ66_9LACO|nr:cytidine deaminase [Ligilactobacillus salitolerans]GBG93671.1 cytidine deaminase [Ligilactobacillus salitolerans]
MDIWQEMYEKAKKEYFPGDVTPFIYAHNVVSAIEAENGEIFVGFCIESCSGVCNLCAERVAALNMYTNSGQTHIKRVIAFRDQAPTENDSASLPCGACREFLMQLDEKNKQTEIMVDYAQRKTTTLEQLIPNWWGSSRQADN